ncbi:3-oxoacyl-[acyl-carrier-protein] reductase FabG [Morella rubra]|uniref:3-oxoacyl-[acyl-carrier-protein] reductase FabG n=1 Tax=Morella rubra TaxID=262757 RepID=A0A6A1UJP9_9ROSI|nr:3-oxoacyl-[acyl-carrier-protein] reductase FabG [Morella rubra]
MNGVGARRSRTVLITGVSKGLGRALALELAKRGHTVIGCSRTVDKLNSLQSELSSPDNHLFLSADVRSNSSVEELARVVMEKKGVPDIIGRTFFNRYYVRTNIEVVPVNSAGTINRNNKIWEVPEEEFDNVIDTNVKGIANMLRHFIPLMIARKQGIIVNMSSGWGRSGAALVAPYCASKWAVEGLTRSVAKELTDGMAIIALNPGVINTDMLVSCFGNSAALYQAPEAWWRLQTKILGMLVCLHQGFEGSYNDTQSYSSGQWCISQFDKKYLLTTLCIGVCRCNMI